MAQRPAIVEEGHNPEQLLSEVRDGAEGLTLLRNFAALTA